MAHFEDKDRYVITGMGMVSPVGNDPETAYQAMLRGEHGVVTAEEFESYGSMPVYVASPVKGFDLKSDPTFKEYGKAITKEWDESQQYILWAGAQALRQAGLSSAEQPRIEDHGIEPERFGVRVGTGVGGANGLVDARLYLEKEREQLLQAIEDGDSEKVEKITGQTRLSPKLILKTLPGRAAGTPSMFFGAKAGWSGVLRECASGNAAIIEAVEQIKLGKADVMLAGGVEGEITLSTSGTFGAAHAVTRNKNPDAASRPFDNGRDGLIMGQGAGAMVVETMEHALNRNAPILAEIIGYADNSDAKDATEPDPANVIKCINMALARTGRPVASFKKTQVNAHATSTPLGDGAEMRAIRGTFGRGQLVAITAVKSFSGHTFGACGTIEAITSVKNLEHNDAPAIRNLENPDPETEGYDHLMHGAVDDTEVVVNNSFGFGGNNAVTIFARPR